MAKKKISANLPPGVFFLVLTCFFLSGFSGLIYEILWTRMMVKIIGSAPFAVSIILTIFMGGLGLGSYLAGRIIDRIEQPLALVKLYGLLELLIGAYALLIPLLLMAFKPLQTILYNGLYDQFIVYNLVTFMISAIILGLPVICMGANPADFMPLLCCQPDASGHPGRAAVRLKHHRGRPGFAGVRLLVDQLMGSVRHPGLCRGSQLYDWPGLSILQL